jgi:hypothetical protein
MSALSNLVPAPDSPDEWVARPGAVLLGTPGIVPKAVVITSGTTWTVPADFNQVNTVYCIGAGGNASAQGGGGGGGACAFTSNVALTPGAVVNIQVGAGGGTTGSGTAPTANTWFGSSALVAAGGGSGTATPTAGVGGTTGNSAGGTKYAGGTGGLYASGTTNAGGGGAAGSTGAGAVGGSASTGVGGTGDATTGGAGGAVGTSGAHNGGAGAAGTEMPGGIGAGGGGGGCYSTGNGGAGGLYGAGGGVDVSGTGGGGAAGVIIVTYTSTLGSAVTCYTVTGNLVVGMMNDPGGSGTDIPFVFNLQSNTFETVTGATTGTNTPTSPSGAGAWQPPHVEMVGYYALISHPGYTEQTSDMYFGAIDLAPLVLPTKTIILTSGTSWVTPSDWNDADNQIQCIGGGTNGTAATGSGTGAHGGTGGGGGGYVSLSNVSLSGTNSIQIGANGTPTWFNSTSNLQAAGGSSGSNVANGAFGSSGVAFAGGSGVAGGAGGGGGTGAYGGAGGGAAGPNGTGANASGTTGGNGDAGFGGVGGTFTTAGGAGTEIGTTGIGSGGGGGGGAADTSQTGGAGGAYGAGGGGGAHSPPSSNGAGGAGSQGVIIIIYTPVQAALTYTAQNTTTNTLISPPVWITQFNSRAYFFCNPGGTNNPALYCSDNFAAGGPLSRGSAVEGVILTFGDNVNLIGGGVLSLTNISTGGVTQALFVFKQAGGGSTNMFQVTGDVGTTNLTVQAMNTSVSTAAPNTIVSTPQGLFFIALDGMRYIDTSGNVQPPVGYDGQGIAIPFVYSQTPSRMAAACNANTIRISTQNSLTNTQQDWCYDLVRSAWHGPHTFPIGLISSWGNTFIVTPTPASGQVGIYESDLVPTSVDVYTELSSPITATWLTGAFPDRKGVLELSSTYGSLYQGGQATLTVSALDVTGAVINGNAVTVTPTSTAKLSAVTIPWVAPLIFDRMQMQVTATAAANLRIADLLIEYEEESYSVTPT